MGPDCTEVGDLEKKADSRGVSPKLQTQPRRDPGESVLGRPSAEWPLPPGSLVTSARLDSPAHWIL